MGLISTYFKWLQKDCPAGEVETYPELDSKNETSLKNCYVAGDLTGIPLLKMAADSGARLVQQFSYDDDFKKLCDQKDDDVFDIVIIGGGPAGISAAIECEKRKLKYVLLEGSDLFNTIKNFPKGKPILTKPDNYTLESDLKIKDGTKESLLEDLKDSLEKHDLNIKCDLHADAIKKNKSGLTVKSAKEEFKTLKVILAIGKSGSARKLDVPGEEKDKVFNRLYDPGEFKDQKILVVGGGDSALEAAAALAATGNEVTISYRKSEFSRPKQENMEEIEKWVKEGKIQTAFESTVKEIHDKSVEMKTAQGAQKIDTDAVFTLIGRELPLKFFKRSGILMEGEKSLSWYVFLVTMVSFFTMLYFGKGGSAVTSIAEAENFSGKVIAFFTAPFGQLQGRWQVIAGFWIGWLGMITFAISGIWSLALMLKERDKYFKPGWPLIKYGYIIIAAIFFSYIYLDKHLAAETGSSWSPDSIYWYSFLYCTTMLLFGIRRAQVKNTRYVKRQTAVLLFIQIVFLFLLPFHIYPHLESWLGKDSIFIQQVFPNGGWSSFALILFWPLNMWEFGSTTFWTIFPFIQTFVFLPLIIWKWGKGAYCGWICSCGGMAETFGDEYRSKSPHGKKAKKWENLGQWILIYAFITTAVVYFAKGAGAGAVSKEVYKFVIDIFFAGVLGLGVYFFMGGRIWCRFGCPLAALMNIYTRFSRYRIVSEKKKCISCNICTKVCHMGIDVMNFANKGKPMNDAQCVRCSACITECPMDVLAFATLEKGDPDNREEIEVPSYGKDDWKAGLK